MMYLVLHDVRFITGKICQLARFIQAAITHGLAFESKGRIASPTPDCMVTAAALRAVIFVACDRR